ncbi:MAG: hypothetical protein N4J56_008057 [Chroococcidiopsis sp. SAG 2025]|uniref:hypothetical protein n=1 Tax=Chroococcidiopsis sp. SAG 2025 TaxID=171389 RepID=UPI0029372635|nr:hypothetical protein [Chroococcidiopsis sp. SAG 2025]MDV2998352.1 hypothetical protein [Chroococcidiopsis sp. SAG 2025]
MPTIKIDNLNPTGSELFSDSESYMNELGDNELDVVSGGIIGIIKSTAKLSKAGYKVSKATYSATKRGVEKTYQKAYSAAARRTQKDPGRSMPGGWGEFLPF